MRFPYARYEVEPSPTVPQGVLYRPEIEIVVGGLRGMAAVQALVDTGSDETVFPASLAGTLGIDLNYGSVSQAAAVGGHEVRLIPSQVTLALSQGTEECRWSAMVVFLEVADPSDEVILLGFAGFLEFFDARFDSENYSVTLVPNRRFGMV